MEGNVGQELVLISQTELDKLDQEYIEYSQKSHKDITHESDYQAALRVPAAFLKRPSNFEQSFDKILFHLDEAYRKSDNENTRIMISRTTDDIFHRVICIIQEKIDYIERENKKGFFQKLSEFIMDVSAKLGLANPRAIFSMEVAPEVGKLTVAFFDFMLTKWEIQKEEMYFYNQLVNVYQKILDSKSFNSQFGLIRNTFATNKEKVLTYVVYDKGLSAAKNLMKYDEKDSEKQDSVRVILRALMSANEWEKGANFLHEIKDAGLANYGELKDECITEFRKFMKYLDTWKGMKDPLAVVKKRFPNVNAIQSLISSGEDGYSRYMTKRKIKIWSITASIIILIIAFFVWAVDEGTKMEQQEKQYQTENASTLQEQWSQIEKTAAAVDALIAEKKFNEAIQLINTGIIFRDTSAGDYVLKAKELKYNKLIKSIDSILTEINLNVSKDMNDELYQYTTETLVPLYNTIATSLKDDQAEHYKEKIKPLLKNIDKARDTYLVQLENTIEDLINNKDYQKANALISILIHKSESKRGLLSKYNEYWDDKRQDLKKRLPADIGHTEPVGASETTMQEVTQEQVPK